MLSPGPSLETLMKAWTLQAFLQTGNYLDFSTYKSMSDIPPPPPHIILLLNFCMAFRIQKKEHSLEEDSGCLFTYHFWVSIDFPGIFWWTNLKSWIPLENPIKYPVVSKCWVIKVNVTLKYVTSSGNLTFIGLQVYKSFFGLEVSDLVCGLIV